MMMGAVAFGRRASTSSFLMRMRRVNGSAIRSASAASFGLMKNYSYYSTIMEMEELPPILPNPPIPPAPTQPLPSKNVFQRLLDRYSITKQQNRILRAESLFQAATRQSSDPRWYGPGRIGRDFRPRHAMLTMHLWLLHKRLIASAADHQVYGDPHSLNVDEELFNILWDDTTCRIRQEGVMELAVNKHLLQVQQYTFLHLTHYDHVYTEFLDQPAQRLKELRNVIWHHIFVRDPALEQRTDHLDRLAWYIDANYRNVMHHWPDEYFRESRVSWVDLPSFEHLKDVNGTIMPSQDVHPDDVLPTPWLQNITNRGTTYYWNPVTGESQYEKPT